ncbi:MAG: hypothetical protein HPY53_11580 [Brevinematales bacterium]|nr:hypothetical protein [Brevinematales bacterium]
MKWMGCKIALLILGSGLYFACAPAAVDDSVKRNTTFPMGTNVSIIYLHHSTGGCVWYGGVPEWFDAYNASNNVNYQITDREYPKSSPYGWENYPYDYWNIWINHAGDTQYMEEDTLEILTLVYDVIVWKHCYPVSELASDPANADITSPAKTIENYKLQYNALKAKMHQFSGNRFIVWTGAALLETNSTSEQATNAYNFFEWVKDTWDEPGDNIYIWDFYTLETGGGIYLIVSNAEAVDNNHPNAVFSQIVAPFFGQRAVNVILGNGDTTGLTGE